MKLAVIGAGGKAGTLIVQEAASRGWQVDALVRNPEQHAGIAGTVRACDADRSDDVAGAVRGADAVALAIGPKPGEPESLANSVRSVIAGMRDAGVERLAIVGGAGSLRTPSGDLLMDTPQFPEAAAPTALAHRHALDALRGETDVDWLYVSPPARFLPDAEATGEYQLGEDDLLTDASGVSQISYADYATAFVDQLEQNSTHRARITVAWK